MAFMFLVMIGMLLALRRAFIGKLVDGSSGYAFLRLMRLRAIGLRNLCCVLFHI